MDKFKLGDRVVYVSDGPDGGCKGTVTHVLGKRIEVSWDDGETYSYADPVSVRLLKQARMHYFATGSVK